MKFILRNWKTRKKNPGKKTRNPKKIFFSYGGEGKTESDWETVVMSGNPTKRVKGSMGKRVKQAKNNLYYRLIAGDVQVVYRRRTVWLWEMVQFFPLFTVWLGKTVLFSLLCSHSFYIFTSVHRSKNVLEVIGSPSRFRLTRKVVVLGWVLPTFGHNYEEKTVWRKLNSQLFGSVSWTPEETKQKFVCYCLCLLWIEKSRVKEKTYKWGSVWWETKI